MRQAQINVRTRACSRTSIARTEQAALTHNVRGKELRPPAGRQYGMSISQQPLNRSLPNFQQLLLKAKLKVSVHLHMGNYANTLRPALHFCGANADYRCDRHSTFVATGLSPHKIASCISANQNCSRPFLRVTVEILLLHQPLKSYKLQYKYFAVFCDFWTCLRNFPKVMADESEAGGGGLRELYADSDSGDEFVGFDAETVRRLRLL